METKYYKVAEFAEIVGINKQKIYKMLEKELKIYEKWIDGYKQISEKAFVLFDKQPLNQEQQNQEQENPKDTDTEKQYIEFLKEENKELKRQLTEKDKIIQEYALKIIEYAEKAQEIADKALTTTSQQQYLQAAEKQKKGFFRRLLTRSKEE